MEKRKVCFVSTITVDWPLPHEDSLKNAGHFEGFH